MQVRSIPRDANPSQELLYGEMRRQGVKVSYLGQMTRSATFNWFLLPWSSPLGAPAAGS